MAENALKIYFNQELWLAVCVSVSQCVCECVCVCMCVFRVYVCVCGVFLWHHQQTSQTKFKFKFKSNAAASKKNAQKRKLYIYYMVYIWVVYSILYILRERESKKNKKKAQRFLFSVVFQHYFTFFLGGFLFLSEPKETCQAKIPLPKITYNCVMYLGYVWVCMCVAVLCVWSVRIVMYFAKLESEFLCNNEMNFGFSVLSAYGFASLLHFYGFLFSHSASFLFIISARTHTHIHKQQQQQQQNSLKNEHIKNILLKLNSRT